MIRPAVRLSDTIIVAAAALSLVGTAALAQSAPRVQPGLWEHVVERVIEPGSQAAAALKQAQAAMANLPPEQRKMMEKMMAEQGLTVQAGAGGVKSKMSLCLTPEDATLDELPGVPEGCTQTVTRSGDTWSMTAQCPASDVQPASSMRGTLTMQGATGYRGDYTISTQGGDQLGPVKMKTQGRWLSADCGAVKPDRR